MGGESGGRTGRWITRLPSENQPGSESPAASTFPHLCQTLTANAVLQALCDVGNTFSKR